MPRGGSAPFSPVVDGRKTCSLCKINKPVSDFYKRGGNRGGYQAGCRACWAVNFKAAKITDPLREFRRYLWAAYRIRPETYYAILEAQGGRCAICRTDNPGSRRWNIDHDHACCTTPAKSCGKCIRGILCGHCNRMLGYAKDSPETLRAAAEYIGGQ